MNSSSSIMSAVLLCSVELRQPRSPLKFKWSSKGNVQHGPQLTILLGGKLDEQEYTCRVSNPASYETATFIAKDCHTDAGLSAGMIALIVIIFIVIICVGLVILFRRQKHKDSAYCKKGQKIDSENPTSSEGPHKKTVGEDRTNSYFDRTPQFNEGLDEETAQEEEKRSLLADQPTASSPQPQKQLDTENAYDVESQQQLPQTGYVRERVVEIDKMTSKKTDNMITKEKNDSEGEDRGSQSNAGGVHSKDDSSCQGIDNKPDQSITELQPSITTEEQGSETTEGGKADKEGDDGKIDQNNLQSSTPTEEGKTHASQGGEDTVDEGKKKDAKGDSDRSSKEDKEPNESQHSGENTQPSSTPEPRGSETAQGGQNTDLSWGEAQKSENSQQEVDKQVPADEYKGDNTNKDNNDDEDRVDKNNSQSTTSTSTSNRGMRPPQGDEGSDDPEVKEAEAKAKSDSHKLSEEEAQSNQSSHSDSDGQPSATAEHKGSETTEAGKDPNLSQEGMHPSKKNQQEPDKLVSANTYNIDNEGDKRKTVQNNPLPDPRGNETDETGHKKDSKAEGHADKSGGEERESNGSEYQGKCAKFEAPCFAQ